MERHKRWWMYDRYDGRNFRPEFLSGVEEFMKFCKENPECAGKDRVRCPCPICKNRNFHTAEMVKVHIYKKGFIPDYYEWLSHGEGFPTSNVEETNPYRDMVIDALGSNHESLGDGEPSSSEEEPNAQAKVFFDLLKAAEQPLYEGSSMSVLEAASRMISLKSEYNLPHRCVDGFASFMNEAIPDNNKMGSTFYATKKILKGLELPHEKIHACPKGCMLFWRADAELDKCRVCGSERYRRTSKGSLVPTKVLIYFPITPRLQRLFATKNIAEEMTWHAKNPRVQGTMAHPSDSEAWKHLDRSFPEFASEPRNIRLGLCTDGFAPHGKFGGQYSCWPVVLTPYNLPPSMCMKKPFMFLSLLVPGPKNPKGNLDVYMQPLIEELKQLWNVGATTYDISKKKNFNLRAAILWTISDFPAYGMLSGWSTAGKKACPYCLDKTKAFWLEHGGKMSWFDCHRQFLTPNHPFRNNKTAFCRNKVEKGSPPHITSGEELWQQVKDLAKVTDGPDGVAALKKLKKGWFKQSILWELPYWKTLLLRHNLEDAYQKKVDESSAQGSQVNPNQLYWETVGGRDRGLVAGLGASASLFYGSPLGRDGSSQSYIPSVASQVDERVQAEVAARMLEVQAQMKQQFDSQLQEALKKEREEVALENQRLMAEMLKNYLSGGTTIPTPSLRQEDDPDMNGSGGTT